MTQDLKVRLLGLLAVGAGLVLGWFFMLVPLRQARAGVPEISMNLKAAYVGGPLFVVMGLAFVIGGEAFRKATEPQDPPRMPAIGWVLILAALALAGVCFWYMEAQFSALGYR